MPNISLGNIEIEVEQKDIKNIHLSIYPPHGRVRIAAPNRMGLDTVRVFALSKLKWIKQQQEVFKNQRRETPREYLTRESHYYQGKRYKLRVIEANTKPNITLTHSELVLKIRPNTPTEKRKLLINEWYREQLKAVVPELMTKWEKVIGVQASEYGIKRMRTKWGTCNTDAKRIWLNLELARKPVICLEYIIVHELVHLIERSHNERFVALMDSFMPQWRSHREELNRLAI
jgi:predicted metal-dependent hydrolase